MEYVFSLADMNNTSMSTVMSASYSNLINTGLTEATPADYSVVKKHISMMDCDVAIQQYLQLDAKNYISVKYSYTLQTPRKAAIITRESHSI